MAAPRADYAGVETVLKDDFLGNLLRVPQQKTTRLFNGFYPQVTVEGLQMYVDGIAPVDYRIDNSQNAPSLGNSASFFRRRLTTDRMIIEIDYDEHWFQKTTDKNPSAIISQEMMLASYRFLDKVGIAAAVADVQYGENGGSTLTFAQDNGITINATGGITEDILRKINHRFTGVEVVQPEGDNMTRFVISEDEQYDMGGLATLISSFYQNIYPQDASPNGNGSGFGKVYGMNVVSFGAQAETGKMLNEASGIRDCLALGRDALLYGMATDGVSFKVIPLDETKISTIRLRMTMTAGAVRKDGRQVIKFQTTAKDPTTFY